jgi:hypothetical protein
MDGRLIFLHHHVRLKAPGRILEGRAACQKWPSRNGEGNYDPEVLGRGDKKSRCWTSMVPVLETDTGRRDEYSKALERTLVKELCNMAP